MARDSSNIALTWRQVVAILFFIGAVIVGIGAIMQFDQEDPRWVASYRLYMGSGFAVCAAVSILFFILHTMNVRQPDLHPDILAQIFGPDGVAEFNAIHFTGMGRQMGPRVRVIVFFQNVFAGPCTGHFELNPIGTTARIPQAKLPLNLQMQGAEVIASWRDLPVPVTGELSFGFNGFVNHARSPRVRFKRRRAVRADSTNNALLAAGLMTGHIHMGAGGRIDIKLESPPPDALATIPPEPWVTISLWSLQDPRSLEDIKELLRHLMED